MESNLPNSSDNAWVPAPSQETICPLCESDAPIEIGTKGRHGIPVRNVVCSTCGTVYVTPRPSRDQMAEFYRSHYRKQHVLPMRLDDGRLAPYGTPEYDTAVEQRGRRQGQLALTMGRTRTGERVLDVGCRRGRTLRTMMETVDIRAFGIEPEETESAIAESHAIQMHTGLLDTFEHETNSFDQVQMFHALEHVHDPLGTLLRLRTLLRPTGRLIIEVPDMMQPYGGLEWFFQYPHLYSFSRNTLTALFWRAGLEPIRGSFAGTVVLVGRPMNDVGPEARPFEHSMLPQPKHDGRWIANRLLTYNGLETIRKRVAKGQVVPIDLLCRLLRRPSLPIPAQRSTSHTGEVALELIEGLSKRGRTQELVAILEAITEGPHDPVLIEQCRLGLERLQGTRSADR